MTRRALARGVALVALALGIAWLPAPACAGDPVKDLVRKVEARYQKTTDLTAEFSQSTDIKGFAKPLQSSGRVYIKRSEEHTSELQSRLHLVCRLLLEKKKNKK